MKMPYEKWSWADTFWATIILIIAGVGMYGSRVDASDSFWFGVYAALAGFGWWKHRERRAEEWWHEFKRQRENEARELD